MIGDATPQEFWESRYADADRIWSGEVNQTLAEVLRDVPPGRALDLGCGEGGDAIWLARRGWHVTGVDISATAIARARAAASEAGVPEGRLELIATDLSTWDGGGRSYDLATASFFHSRVELPRTEILRRVARLLRPGGALVLVSHAAFPPWAANHDHAADGAGQEPHFLTPEEEIAALALGEEWSAEIAETRTRLAMGPDGQQAELEDGVVLLRRGQA